LVGVNLVTAIHVITLTPTGSISPKRKEKCGRKKKTTARDDAYLLRQTKDPCKARDTVNTDLKEKKGKKGIEIS